MLRTARADGWRPALHALNIRKARDAGAFHMIWLLVVSHTGTIGVILLYLWPIIHTATPLPNSRIVSTA